MMRYVLLALLVSSLGAPAARADLLADIRSRGVLKVGMAEVWPWMTRNEAGELEGLEVDLVERLAGDLGVQAEIVPMPFDQLIDRLAAREVDLVASDLSITPARALRVAFSEPYSVSEINAVARLDRFAEAPTLEDLNAAGVQIAVTAGTTNAETASKLFPMAELLEFTKTEEARQAAVDGQAAAYVGSTPHPELLVASYPEQLAIVGEEPLRTTVEAFAVPLGEHQLLTFLNNWIDAMDAEGFLMASRLFWLSEAIGGDVDEEMPATAEPAGSGG